MANVAVGRATFSGIVSNLVQIYAIMAQLGPKMRISIWQSLPCWNSSDLNCDDKANSETRLSVSLSNLVRIRSIFAELSPFNWFPKFHRRHLRFCGIPVPMGSLFSMSVSHLVRMRSEMAEFSPFNWFPNGGRRHLGFLHYVNFYGKPLYRTPFSALYQIQCKYVQYCPSSGKKVTFSMAAAVILDFVRYKFWQ